MAFRKETRIIDGVRTLLTIDLTDEEIAEEEARVAASVAAKEAAKVPRREGEFREFLALFTDAEQAAIKTAAMNPSNVALALWYDKALGGATMSLDHSETDTGLSALVAAGLITSERKTVILASDFDLV